MARKHRRIPSRDHARLLAALQAKNQVHQEAVTQLLKETESLDAGDVPLALQECWDPDEFTWLQPAETTLHEDLPDLEALSKTPPSPHSPFSGPPSPCEKVCEAADSSPIDWDLLCGVTQDSINTGHQEVSDGDSVRHEQVTQDLLDEVTRTLDTTTTDDDIQREVCFTENSGIGATRQLCAVRVPQPPRTPFVHLPHITAQRRPTCVAVVRPRVRQGAPRTLQASTIQRPTPEIGSGARKGYSKFKELRRVAKHSPEYNELLRRGFDVDRPVPIVRRPPGRIIETRIPLKIKKAHEKERKEHQPSDACDQLVKERSARHDKENHEKNTARQFSSKRPLREDHQPAARSKKRKAHPAQVLPTTKLEPTTPYAHSQPRLQDNTPVSPVEVRRTHKEGVLLHVPMVEPRDNTAQRAKALRQLRRR